MPEKENLAQICMVLYALLLFLFAQLVAKFTELFIAKNFFVLLEDLMKKYWKSFRCHRKFFLLVRAQRRGLHSLIPGTIHIFLLFCNKKSLNSID